MVRPPEPFLVVASVLGRTLERVNAAVEGFCDRFGTLGFASEPIPFSWTDYYRDELGSSPFRRIIALDETMDPARLVELKRFTCRLEVTLSRPESRDVNIDPGVLNEHQLVLASTKSRAHRIYLGHGIYGDLMLIRRGEGFAPLEWTYPDYSDAQVGAIFDRLRSLYLAKRRIGTRAEEIPGSPERPGEARGTGIGEAPPRE
jgi:hypothetical protein